MKRTQLRTCPANGCEVSTGERHRSNCSIARCKQHGHQFISCDSNGSHIPSIFKGEYPGTSEAIERGWFVRFFDGKGWVQCSQEDPDSQPDLNRVTTELIWNNESEKFS